jgi:hypothetical protein
MRTYRINCTDDSDLIVATYAFRCSDDLDALDKATELCAANGVEVWDGARRVVWMHKGGAVRFKIEHRLARPIPSLLASSIARLNGLVCNFSLSPAFYSRTTSGLARSRRSGDSQ